MVLEAAGAERNKEYGRIILRLLENFMNPLRTPGLVGILEDKRQLRRRIGMIANYSPSPRWSLLPVVLIAALTLLGLTDARSNDSADGAPVSASAGKAGFQLTIDLRDGSRVVGRMPDDTLNFHADALGDIKLAWADIRSIEYNTSTNTARLTTTSGDAFTGQIKADTLPLETGFGKTEIAVGLIRSIKVSVTARPNIPAPPIAAAAADTNQPLPRLTVELRDGSQVIGTSVVKFFKFRSALLGELKLGVNDIRSAECVSSNSVKLTVANGDTLMVAFADSGFTVMTSFGKADLTVDSIRKITVAAAGATILQRDGLVAFWSGDGNPNDSVGGNNGTMMGGANFAAGLAGQAFSFDEPGDFVKIPKSPGLDLGSQMTLEFWMRPDAANVMNNYQGLVTSDFYGVEISNGYGGTMGVNFFLSVTSGQPSRQTGFGMQNFSRLTSVGNFTHVSDSNNGGAVVSAGRWHHIAATYDGAQLKLYVDGQLWGKSVFCSGSIAPMLPSSFVTIGSEDGRTTCPDCVGSRYFKGQISGVAIYKRALSADEIREDYEAGNAN
jgi:hypothetical protein